MIRIWIASLLGLSLLLDGSLPVSARAGRLPNLDVRAVCTLERNASSDPEDRASYRGCLTDEYAARRTVMRRWWTFGATERRACREESRIGARPSYVSLLTCLQLGSGDLPIRPSF